jgi:hypothetical protein
MRTGRYSIILLAAAFLGSGLFYACKEKYTPVVNDINPNYLVVEGLINIGADSTIFTLNRTFKLDNKAIVAAEKAAIVQVESDAGTTYVLPELVKSGNYGRPSLNLDQTKKHRLRIRTKDGKEYLSSFVEGKISPPVDKVTHDFRRNQFNLYASTHDDTGKSRYYKYHFTETWEYTAPMWSYYKIENHQILPRLFPQDDIFHCWKTANSTNIVLGNSTNNGEDRIEELLVNSLAPTSFKILRGYSILVKQTVLTKEGFDFWQAMQKNTEQVGSIFDSQPSQLFGNIKSTTNPDEVVIGFVSAGTVTENRLTLSTYAMVPEWRQDPEFNYREICDPLGTGAPFRTFLFTTPLGRADISRYLLEPDKPGYLILDYWPPVGEPMGWATTSEFKCADCRLQGGINVRPPYWYKN